MKKKIPRLAAAALCLALALAAAGCGRYVSGYKAVGLVRSGDSSSASMSFISFDGTMVFRLKSGGGEELTYRASLESGEAAVYYDCGSGKEELFSLRGGDEAGPGGVPVGAGTVYILIETDGTCRDGDIRVRLE